MASLAFARLARGPHQVWDIQEVLA